MPSVVRAVVMLLASGCASLESVAQTPPAGVMPTVAGMTCGPDRLTVVIQRGVARVTFRGQSYEMPQVPAASGAKYQVTGDSTTSFWSKGRRATVVIGGTTFPECAMNPAPGQPQVQPPAPGAPRFSATGNEPGWRLDVDPAGSLTLLTDNGAATTAIPRPDVVTIPGGRIYRGSAEGRDVEVRVTDTPCVDTMTGLPRPAAVEVRMGARVLRGCGGDAATLLHGAPWVVDDVAGAATVAGSRVSLEFRPDGRLGGSASCNNLRGQYRVTAEGLSIVRPATTMKACAPAVMAQERVVLTLLESVRRFEIAADGALVLHAADGRTLRARR